MAASPRQHAEDEIARIAERSGTLVGLCAIHPESGEGIELNAQDSFPLASTYKIPISVRLLKLVQEGRLSLEQMIEVGAEDLSPGSGLIKDVFTVPGLQLSLRNLLRLSILFSDNTASDIVLRLAGEGDEVTKMLRSVGIDGIRVDRFAKHILCEFYGLSDMASQTPWSLERFRARLRETDESSRKAGIDAFALDSRDRGTPSALVALLTMLVRGQLLGPDHTNVLLDLMRKCQTGPARLKGQLPKETVVAHKTGSIEGLVVNDAGIIELPDGRGRIVIAVFVQSRERKVAEMEAVIAQIARTVYDHFLESA